MVVVGEGSEVRDDELVNAPVLVGAVRQVAPDDDWDLLVSQLLGCNL